MELANILSDYDAVITDCRELLEQELLNVRNGATNPMDFEDKRTPDDRTARSQIKVS